MLYYALSMGITQQFFVFFLCLVTLIFELGLDFCKMYLTTNFDGPTSRRLSCGQTMTNKQMPLKTSTSLCCAVPVGKNLVLTFVRMYNICLKHNNKQCTSSTEHKLCINISLNTTFSSDLCSNFDLGPLYTLKHGY